MAVLGSYRGLDDPVGMECQTRHFVDEHSVDSLILGRCERTCFCVHHKYDNPSELKEGFSATHSR